MSAIDLSQLPAPDVIETLDYETLLERKKQRLLDLCESDQRPAMEAALALESDPVTKLLEESAYAELILRQRVNDAARRVMLPYATGADLDVIAANLGVERLLISPADASVIPPIAAIYESDDRLRLRAQMAMEGLTVAGSRAAYVFHALSASASIKDVSVISPVPGDVELCVLAIDNGGIADAPLLSIVTDHVSSDDIRPLTDRVTVRAAEIIPYQIQATLTIYPGPADGPVLSAAIAAITAFAEANFLLDHDISLSGLYAALHQAGVQRVDLQSPAASIEVGPQQAARCTAIMVTIGGRDV